RLASDALLPRSGQPFLQSGHREDLSPVLNHKKLRYNSSSHSPIDAILYAIAASACFPKITCYSQCFYLLHCLIYTDSNSHTAPGRKDSMLEAFYATERGSLEDITINGDFDLHPDLVWLDLIAPSQEEQQWILDAYAQNLPTLKSLEDISSSARFYR